MEGMETPEHPRPSVGRVVHYVSRGSADLVFPSSCRAAIVTETDVNLNGDVSLCVLNPSGMFFDLKIEHDEDNKVGGTWHWPERV